LVYRLHLLGLHLFDAVSDVPAVPEGVSDAAGPLAVELVRRLYVHRATGVRRAADDRIGVVHVEMQRYRRAPVGFRFLDAILDSSACINVDPPKSSSAWPIRPPGSVS
jgi:hypothetical protein